MWYLCTMEHYSAIKKNEIGGGREVQEGGYICIQIADSLRYTAETNITL